MTRFRPPEGDESNLELVRVLVERIEQSGPITFAEFVEIVAGHPEHGYYATSVERAGTSGDFLTAPETHPIFGWLVARQVLDLWENAGRPSSFAVREFGAGRGTLARQVLQWIDAHPPPALQQLTYQIEDLNPDHVPEGQAVVETGSEALNLALVPAEQTAMTGVMFANELLDALPFHRLVNEEGDVREVRVAFEDGWFVERSGPLSAEARDVLSDGLSIDEGQRFEVSPASQAWVRRAAGMLERGFLIVIDYGYERPDLFDAGRFPNGTLKTYRQHDVGENPYRHVGRQDITAHVDFSAVIDAATASGLRLEGLTSQAEFVAGLGIDEILMDIQRLTDDPNVYGSARAAAMELLNPGGLGRFRVAIFSKGVDVTRPIRGLAFQMPGLIR